MALVNLYTNTQRDPILPLSSMDPGWGTWISLLRRKVCKRSVERLGIAS